MKIKLVLAFLSGAVLTAAVIMAITVITPSARAEKSPVNIDNINIAATDNGTSMQDLTDALNRVRSEIHDPEILAYYDKLVTSYHLEDTPASGIPDIEAVQRSAMTMPLVEAGKTIKDPDLKDFYQQFLERSGFLTVE
jgi:hypothetical protein